MSASVGQIIDVIQQIAPSELAESWDNVGLQIGSASWEIDRIWVSLDPLLHVVEHACREKVGILITHHPLFFKKLSRIDTSTMQGRLIELALSRKLAILCAHTNLDIVAGGVNDILASKIGLVDTKVLKKTDSNDLYKLVVFVPADSEKAVSNAIFSAGAGQIGNYSCCSFKSKGVGTFRPEKDSKPSLGKYGFLSEVEEIKVESIVNKQRLREVVESIKQVHPYETVPYDVYPTLGGTEFGIGRVGKLEKSTSLYELVELIKSVLGLDIVKVSGDLNMIIRTVAVCSGSGGSFIQNFFTSKAQAYVTSGISYHDAREAHDLGLSVIDIGHFSSEKIIVDELSRQIKKNVKKIDENIDVFGVSSETDVFKFL